MKITGAIEQQRFAPKCSYNTSGGGINGGLGGVSIVILMYQQHQLFQRGFVSMVVWSVHKVIHSGSAIARMLVRLEDESNSHTKDSGGRMLKSIDGALGRDIMIWWDGGGCGTGGGSYVILAATNDMHVQHFASQLILNIPSTL